RSPRAAMTPVSSTSAGMPSSSISRSVTVSSPGAVMTLRSMVAASGTAVTSSGSPLAGLAGENTPAEQHGENHYVQKRIAQVLLHGPKVVDRSADRADVDQPVQRHPSLSAEPAHPALRGRDR